MKTTELNSKSLETKTVQFDECKTLVEKIRIGMFVTHGHDGRIRSVPMTLQSCDLDTKTLWFMCRETAGAAQDLQQDSNFLVSFSHPGKNEYVSASGSATVVHDAARIKEYWNFATDAWFPEGPDDPSLRLIRAEIENAEIWDGPSSGVALVLMLANTLVGNTRPLGMGTHEKLAY